MKLSIITVCYNSEDSISNTLESILNQTFNDFECIFIDGDSTDRTCEIIHDYEREFNDKGIKMTLVSEPDRGIYDAMNKGAKLANGEWITYMNSDDLYYDNDALSSVFAKDTEHCDLIYGNTYFNKPGESGIKRAKEIDTITHHLPFCPQAAFVRTYIQNKLMFDSSFSISADYDFFLRCYLAQYRIMQIEETIAIFNWGGISNSNLLETYKQDTLVKMKNGIISRYSVIVYMKWLYFILKFMVDRVICRY